MELNLPTDGFISYRNIHTGDTSSFCPGEVRGGLLADPMGLGKSLSIISLLATDSASYTTTSSSRRLTLLIVPSSLVRTWDEEFALHTQPGALKWRVYHGPNRFHKFLDMSGCDIVVTTYNILASDWRNSNKRQSPPYKQYWHRIVLDEGKFIPTR